MDQISRDSPLEMLSDINPASPFPDDSFSKSPFNSALKSFAKLDIKSNSSIEGSFRDIIKRMQNEVDTLLHENAELKSRGSVSTDNQNSNHQVFYSFEEKNKKVDNFSNREIEKQNNMLKSVGEKDAIIQSLTEKVDEFQEKIKLLEKENNRLQIEVKKRDNYLQQKLQLEIDIKKGMRLNQELQAKLGVQEHQTNLMHLSTRQNSVIQDNNSVTEEVEEFEREISQKNRKIDKLDKENKLSRDMNQTLVKVLKLKNLQIQANKILSKKEEKEQIDIDTTKKNLEKFENEEKKLLRMLEIKMKQYEEIENEN